MKRAVAVSIVCLVVAPLFAACNGGHREHAHHRGHLRRHAACAAQTTCGTCTPVVGCGWCFGEGGSGSCVDGPDECPAHATGFTWDPPGCTDDGGIAGPDGGHTLADAGLGGPEDDAGDAASDADADADVDAGTDGQN